MLSQHPKNKKHFKKSGTPGQDTQNEDNGRVKEQGDTTHGTTGTCDNRERRCDMMMVVHF